MDAHILHVSQFWSIISHRDGKISLPTQLTISRFSDCQNHDGTSLYKPLPRCLRVTTLALGLNVSCGMVPWPRT